MIYDNFECKSLFGKSQVDIDLSWPIGFLIPVSRFIFAFPLCLPISQLSFFNSVKFAKLSHSLAGQAFSWSRHPEHFVFFKKFIVNELGLVIYVLQRQIHPSFSRSEHLDENQVRYVGIKSMVLLELTS